MGSTPLPDPLHFLRPTPVIVVGRALGPDSLLGRFPGLLTSGLGTEALVVAVAGIGNEQLLTVRTFAPPVVDLHVAPCDVLPPEENGKPRRRNDPRRPTAVRKKEEQIGGEEPEENRSRKRLPFRRPALGTLQKTAGTVEHRLFSEISKHWSGQPLTDYETIVRLIRGTRTQTGLVVNCSLSTKHYPTDVQVSNHQMDELDLLKHPVLPEWNYTLLPRTARN